MAEKTTKKKTAAKKVATRIFGKDTGKSVEAPGFLQTGVSTKLLAQILHVQNRRSRIRRAHTKERAEVRGGGRKPWKQKGTGRARHGSRRSPLWVGGGTTFGPRVRKETVGAASTGVRRKAFCGALAHHVANETLEIVKIDSIPEKTKEAVAAVAGMTRLLILVDSSNAGLQRVLRNIPWVTVKRVTQATVKDVLAARSVWIDEAGMSMLETRCQGVVNEKK